MSVDTNLEEIINKAASAGATAAIKKYKDDEFKEKRRKAFHNAELLLRKYDMLVEHCQNAELDEEDVEVVYDCIKYTDLDEEDLYLKSVLRTKGRTQKMLHMIDKSIMSLKRELEEKDQLFKYQAIDLVYLKKKSFEDAAIELNCNKETVRRWKNDVIRDLSVYLFGADGLNIDL